MPVRITPIKGYTTIMSKSARQQHKKIPGDKLVIFPGKFLDAIKSGSLYRELSQLVTIGETIPSLRSLLWDPKTLPDHQPHQDPHYKS